MRHPHFYAVTGAFTLRAWIALTTSGQPQRRVYPAPCTEYFQSDIVFSRSAGTSDLPLFVPDSPRDASHDRRCVSPGFPLVGLWAERTRAEWPTVGVGSVGFVSSGWRAVLVPRYLVVTIQVHEA